MPEHLPFRRGPGPGKGPFRPECRKKSCVIAPRFLFCGISGTISPPADPRRPGAGKERHSMEKSAHDAKTLKRAKFCKDGCPVCKRARAKGRGIAYQLVRLERHICPNCRAYEKVYGKPAYQ